MSNLIRYNSRAIFISTGQFDSDQESDGSLYQFGRVQDFGVNINYPIEDEDYLDSNAESVVNNRPTADITVNWLLTNGENERSAGFVTNGISGALLNLDVQKNIYILTEANNADAVGSVANKTVFGIGNTLLSSYNLNASVGSFINGSASFIGLNITSYTGSSNQIVPSVNYVNGNPISSRFTLPKVVEKKDDASSNTADNISALHPKDIILEFEKSNPFAVVTNSLHLQSFDFNLGLERFDVAEMGNSFPEQRPTIYPVSVDFTVEALVPAHIAGNLADGSCLGSGANMNLIIKQPCSDFPAFELKLKELKLEGQSFGQSVGGYESMTLQWKGRITNPLDLKNNIYMEAFQGDLVYSLLDVIPISGYDENGILHYSEESIYERKLQQNSYTFKP